jgi:rubrerythrin
MQPNTVQITKEIADQRDHNHEQTRAPMQYPSEGPEAHCPKCGLWNGSNSTFCPLCEPEKDPLNYV